MLDSSTLPGPLLGQKGEMNGTHGTHITDFTVSIPSSSLGSSKRPSAIQTRPSRWRTLEFYFYYLAFILVVPIMVYIPITLSTSDAANYPVYAHRLHPGWLFGRQIDMSDAQYRKFRYNLVPLLALAGAYMAGSLAHASLPQRWSRTTNIAILSLATIFILHGFSSFKILVILALNYVVCGPLRPSWMGRYWPALLIVGHMGMLMLNERMAGYPLGQLHAELGSLEDWWGGFQPRWHVSFNITMLRMVSYGLDRFWHSVPVEEGRVPRDHRERTTLSPPLADYNFVNYLAYCLYPPLYIAGPIMTFNDFVWQAKHPVQISRNEKVGYAIRFLFCLLSIESVLHMMYVVAIKDAKAWFGNGPAALSMIGFWNLVVVWLKLLIPWRFFRLWALLDGVDPPENMVRCVANNYSTLGFWKSWHRSYNLWIVRYIYIPVGGSRTILNQALATVLVFTFVALWHDLSMNLLWWGWLVSLFILPEIGARFLFPAEKYGQEWWYRHLCALGGVLNILMMMSANLVGFVLGLDGMRHLLVELWTTTSGQLFILFASSCLFIAVQVMFEYREEEKRRGIDRKC